MVFTNHVYFTHLEIPSRTYARFTPNRDQLRTDLRVEKLWISRTREQSLNFRELAFTSMSGSDWHTSEQKVYNWPSNNSDLWPRPSHAIRKSIGINSGPQNHNHGANALIHLRPTSDWPVMLCDRLATNLRLGRDRLELPMWLGKKLHEIKNSRVTCDRFTTVANDIRGHRMNYEQPATKGGSSCELCHSQVKFTSSTTVFDG